MSVTPLIIFKAGKCELDTSSTPPKVKAVATPGYIYLYMQDEFVHFCWRPRSAPASSPELDLFMVPGDGTFIPYTGSTDAGGDDVLSPTDGRIFVLKFQSSSQRHLFWMQSKSQHPEGNPSWFSPRDQKLGQIIDIALSGEDIDIQVEIRDYRNNYRRGGNNDEDEAMEDADDSGPGDRTETGGAGPGATGGDIRDEGEEAREGGADGGRAAAPSSSDHSAIVQNFLNSLKGNNLSGPGQQGQSKMFTTLADLLSSDTTIPIIEAAPASMVDRLISHLPSTILLLAQEADMEDLDEGSLDADSDIVQAAIAALSEEQKLDLLKRVLRSPQLHQSLGSLTAALRDGGLPTMSEALKVPVQNGGFIRAGGVPLGGGEAVEAFLDGVKKSVEDELKEETMETD